MPLADIVSRLNNETVADQLIEYIYSEGRDLAISPDEYIEKYFDKEIRKSVFDGTVCAGGVVNLSAKAALLRDAFQRRFGRTQEFPPVTAYHGTKDRSIAELILKGGFDQAREKLFGPGVYFYTYASSYRAESIAIQAGKQTEDEQDIKTFGKIIDTRARRDARETAKGAIDKKIFERQRMAGAQTKAYSAKQEGIRAIATTRLASIFKKYRWDKGCVLRVTIFSNTGFNSGIEQQHKDKLIEKKDDVLVVKNALAIFPTAVFVPGEEQGAEADGHVPGVADALANLAKLQKEYKGRG
jgi:hypothetical protein